MRYDDDYLVSLVKPIYLKLGRLYEYREEVKAFTKQVIDDVNVEVVTALFEKKEWRGRSTGAYFAAIKALYEVQDQVGELLFKSELVYAGKTYCLALALFNNEKSTSYLHRYLDHYLVKPDLYYDQGEAMSALSYLDDINGTDEISRHLDSWHNFISDKEGWDLTRFKDRFERNMITLGEIKLLSTKKEP